MTHFPFMARFNAWANARLYGCVADLPDEVYRRDCGLFFGSIHGTLNHILVVDRMWTRRLEGMDHGLSSLDQILYDDFAGLRTAQKDENARLIELADSLTAQELARPLRYRRMIGTGIEEARRDHVLLTLFNHQTYHRGQVTAALTQAGVTPPPLDIGFYTEETGQSGDPGTVKTGA